MKKWKDKLGMAQVWCSHECSHSIHSTKCGAIVNLEALTLVRLQNMMVSR
jgi:hypothetical protein